MIFDWESNGPYCYMDIETQSAVNLRTVGGRAYAHDPTTRLLSAVFKYDDSRIIWTPEDRLPPKYTCGIDGVTVLTDLTVPEHIRELAKTHTFVAHNCEVFDAQVWQRLYPDCQPRWFDTIHLCRLYGYPAGIDAASKALGGPGKGDDTAMRLMMDARVVSGKVVYPRGTKPLWDKLIEYNIRDVEELERIARILMSYPRGREGKILAVSTAINQRGMYIDLPFARRLRDCWDTLRNASADEVSSITGGKLNAENIRSTKQVKEYLAALGFPVDSLNSATVNQILNEPERYIEGASASDDDARLALAILAERQNATRNTVGKLDRLFTVIDPDSVVRNALVYGGAQSTLRFSGRGLQPHNFPRGVIDGATVASLVDNLSYDAVCKIAECTPHPTIRNRNVSTSDVLSSLSRSVIAARPKHKLTPIDYAAIEARGIAWIARCDKLLHIFATGGDPYKFMAASLYGKDVKDVSKNERFVGKQIVLGCGYQMGAPKFALSCKMYLIDLDAANTTAAACVETYRATFPEIPAVWRALNKAALYVCQNPHETVVAGRCVFGYENGFMYIELPSGRRLRYRNARVVIEPMRTDPTGRAFPQVVFDSAYGYRKSLYGGILAENIVQAMSRDILCHHLIQSAPIAPTVLHVHDEIVPECPEERAEVTLRTIGSIMVDRPEWCRDFPLACEGFTARHYSKAVFPGELELKFTAQV